MPPFFFSLCSSGAPIPHPLALHPRAPPPQTGINGNDFKVHWLMNKCDIQVNKTSRNSVLFQTNIGTTFSSTTFLIQSLSKCMYQFQKEHIASGGHLSSVWRAAVDGLTKNHALLPDFTEFHASFRPKDTLGNEVSAAAMRDAPQGPPGLWFPTKLRHRHSVRLGRWQN